MGGVADCEIPLNPITRTARRQMADELLFEGCLYDSCQCPPPSEHAVLFTGLGSSSPERVTGIIEEEILRWLLRTPPARKLLFAKLELSEKAYAQASVIEPVLDRKLV